jgi:hypothetical protein
MILWIFKVQTPRIALPVTLKVNAWTEEGAIEILRERILRLDGPPKVEPSAFTLIEKDDFLVSLDKDYVTKGKGYKVVDLVYRERTKDFSGSIRCPGKPSTYAGWTVNGRNPNPNLRLVEKKGA